eukprot:CAMPEP_0117554600 /NCGR_PEP_ID=MMETSP0784-20121206/50838_1 /TAXON_ID=39447 /ORGANISM="" /LENGTH=148 /DNA_ID=CAMNT_0005351771 /DNA_START=268 /DNA_END=711 /DNA_ORIENTATION=+
MRFESTCEEPLVEFLVCVGVASCVATSYNFYLAFISETSDTCWWMIMALDFFINVARFVICYYGLQMLGRMQHVCSDAEAQVVRLNCVSIVVATTLLGLTDYFMYLPNFVLQLTGSDRSSSMPGVVSAGVRQGASETRAGGGSVSSSP